MLFLVHHGDAVGADVDPMRPLSSRGLTDVESLAQQAAARGAKPDVVWHSGKMRARQTAERYHRRCNPFATFAATRGLQPNDPTDWILDLIAGDTRSIMLAGHFPHLPRVLARLRSGKADAGAAEFPLNGIVALEEREGQWVEQWRLYPLPHCRIEN